MALDNKDGNAPAQVPPLPLILPNPLSFSF
jgi:hypothetical protein